MVRHVDKADLKLTPFIFVHKAEEGGRKKSVCLEEFKIFKTNHVLG